eukprot:CAMPEP_0202897184 /NCGR_PEP_ID=MMETSP1392-20130828/6012_1 /ASSEMBLY_ACC=CAM_ASM_000868 /TAXON_ID=225041 /ORGANISM="Chlamydomonas chlamydogama, Strain SAG 11-48b" /LENGTH=427 /DNA_ID=CAMNT_0049582761 /DNA_START=1470 /DNA_END=2753 /DNA_ORIENTATION=-
MTETFIDKAAAPVLPDGTTTAEASSTSPTPGFMTQAARKSGSKRKSGVSQDENLDNELSTRKRSRLSAVVTASTVQETVPENHHDKEPSSAAQDDAHDQQIIAEEEVGKQGSTREGTPGPSNKGKSVLETVFSPLFSAFHRGAQHSNHVPATNGDVKLLKGPDVEDSQENVQPSHNPHANGHHAHHPPPPEVPEAAESEYEEADAEEQEEDVMEFDPLLFIKTLPPLENCIPKYRNAILPRKTRQCKQKTLVLDLDETLVHSSLESVASSDFSFPVHFNNQEHIIHVKQRPHLHDFMQRVSELFEVVVFTASQKIYAERLLNVIDPNRQYIKHRIYRDSCVIVDGNYLKDLTVLGRDLRSTFIIDNSPQAFGFQVDNGIPIESWYDDEEDTELLKLLPFLEGLVDVDDVRPHIAAKFRLKELVEKAC